MKRRNGVKGVQPKKAPGHHRRHHGRTNQGGKQVHGKVSQDDPRREHRARHRGIVRSGYSRCRATRGQQPQPGMVASAPTGPTWKPAPRPGLLSPLPFRWIRRSRWSPGMTGSSPRTTGRAAVRRWWPPPRGCCSTAAFPRNAAPNKAPGPPRPLPTPGRAISANSCLWPQDPPAHPPGQGKRFRKNQCTCETPHSQIRQSPPRIPPGPGETPPR